MRFGDLLLFIGIVGIVITAWLYVSDANWKNCSKNNSVGFCNTMLHWRF